MNAVQRRAERFFPGAFEVQPNGCWIWKRGTSGSGYGAVSICGRVWGAHRAV